MRPCVFYKCIDVIKSIVVSNGIHSTLSGSHVIKSYSSGFAIDGCVEIVYVFDTYHFSENGTIDMAQKAGPCRGYDKLPGEIVNP